jgi:hypothetical protein
MSSASLHTDIQDSRKALTGSEVPEIQKIYKNKIIRDRLA